MAFADVTDDCHFISFIDPLLTQRIDRDKDTNLRSHDFSLGVTLHVTRKSYICMIHKQEKDCISDTLRAQVYRLVGLARKSTCFWQNQQIHFHQNLFYLLKTHFDWPDRRLTKLVLV